MTHSRIVSLPFMGWAVAILALAAGCGTSGPKVHPVEGKVVFKGKPGNLGGLIGGMVHFQSTSDPKLTAIGSIEDDGVFSMAAMLNEKELKGVPAGTYKACLEPPDGNDDDDDNSRIPIPTKYLDFDKSGLKFTVPVQGEIVIEIER